MRRSIECLADHWTYGISCASRSLSRGRSAKCMSEAVLRVANAAVLTRVTSFHIDLQDPLFVCRPEPFADEPFAQA